MPRARLLLLLSCLAGLSACASDPHDRIVRARFSCADGRRLAVQFRLDRRDAVLRVDRARPVTLPATGAARGRSYAGLAEGGAWSLSGLGDRVDLRSPGAPVVQCEETR